MASRRSRKRHVGYAKRVFIDLERKNKRGMVTFPKELFKVVDYDDKSNWFEPVYASDHAMKFKWSKAQLKWFVILFGGKAAFWLDDYDMKSLLNKRLYQERSKAFNGFLRKMRGVGTESGPKTGPVEVGTGDRSVMDKRTD